MIKTTEKRTKDGPVRRAVRRIRRAAVAAAFAGALLAEGPLARAEEPPPRPPITLKTGAAYDHAQRDFRTMAIVGSKLPLPARMTLDASVGFAGSLTTPGAFSVEEAKLSLGVPIAGPVFMDLYGHNSRHFAVRQFALGADVGVTLPFGAALVGFENIFDGGQRPVYGVLAVDAIRKRLSFSVSGGYVTNCGAGTAGAGVRVNLGDGLPALSVHSMAIFNREALLFSDTRAMLEFEL